MNDQSKETFYPQCFVPPVRQVQYQHLDMFSKGKISSAHLVIFVLISGFDLICHSSFLLITCVNSIKRFCLEMDGV